MVGGLFSLAYGIPAIVEYYHKKTIYISIGTIGAAVVNVVLNYIFIPKFGYVAAAYTTLFSYAMYYLFHSIISYRIARFTIIPIYVLIVGYGMVFVCACITFLTLNHPMVRYLVLLIAIMIALGIIYLKRTSLLSMIKDKNK